MHVLALQRGAGNQAVTAMLARRAESFAIRPRSSPTSRSSGSRTSKRRWTKYEGGSPVVRIARACCAGTMNMHTPPSRPGIDVPDHRGRTGLDRAGLDLTGNPRVRVRDVELLAAGWHVLRKTTYDYQRADGTTTIEARETYDRGDGATLLCYDAACRTVLLSRQFRFPVYVNGHPDGMLIETAAGLLDEDDPKTAMLREASEELGVELDVLEHVFDVYMSPGSVTEKIHFYAARYTAGGRRSRGGGIAAEGEDIEVVELAFDEALAMIDDGRICDAKTILLLHWAALRGPFRT
jgi:nudix-type nucleoside diphosphatase (YffH/AdpP family)